MKSDQFKFYARELSHELFEVSLKSESVFFQEHFSFAVLRYFKNVHMSSVLHFLSFLTFKSLPRTDNMLSKNEIFFKTNGVNLISNGFT